MVYLGSDVKNDAWLNTYDQQSYSDLTGTIRELRSSDGNDNADKRFQPPLETNNPKISPTDEGYQIASSELISPVISVSLNKEPPHERQKRDTPSNTSSTSVNPLQTTSSVTTGTISTTTPNNTIDNDLIISDADADAWARSLLLATAVDGSGSEADSKCVPMNVIGRVNKSIKFTSMWNERKILNS